MQACQDRVLNMKVCMYPVDAPITDRRLTALHNTHDICGQSCLPSIQKPVWQYCCLIAAVKQASKMPLNLILMSFLNDKGCCCQLWMAGTGHQSYVTTLKCPATGSVTNTATLLAATGQRLTATASVVKNCFDLTVRLGAISPPTIAK